jgi:thiamine kinase-like enzyme
MVQLLRALVAHRALDARDAREVHRLAAVHAPRAATARVCHTDLCPDNLVLTDGGQVSVVDTEGLTVDAAEYDLARTWYRWPMTASQQRAYAEGYGAHAHAAAFADHFLHWALQAVTESAAFRVRRRAAGAHVPLARLADLVRTHGRGEAFPRLLARG